MIPFFYDFLKKIMSSKINFKFCKKLKRYKNPVIEALPSPECQLAFPQAMWEFDAYTVTCEDLNLVKKTFNFKAIVSGEVHGLCIWFDCDFGNDIILTTGPDSYVTHWYQTCLYSIMLPEITGNNPCLVKQDDPISVALSIIPKSRSLEIVMYLTIKDQFFTSKRYRLDPGQIDSPCE